MEGRSLLETPTWSVATVITTMVVIGFLIQGSISRIKKWLVSTRRKALLAALETIVEEMMMFGLLSLLMGHWTIWFSRICIKEKALNTHFYPCLEEDVLPLDDSRDSRNQSSFRESERYNYCPEGLQPFVSHDSLEQLHRFLLVLGVVHVTYCFLIVTVATLKINSWRKWESQAESKIIQYLEGSTLDGVQSPDIKCQSTSISQHASQTCSQNKVLVFMICFICQFWRSINKADYMVLRSTFIMNHKLHASYNFHNYMLRSMEDEFRDIVGISVPLWGYAIIFILLNIHGTGAYFWLSFIPAALILIVGAKLHCIVVQLALELRDENPFEENHLKLRDELFWFGRPELLLWLIRLISFQNAFEMATLIWSLWEINATSCFMKNYVFMMIRLTSGILFQFWCSCFTFPLYVITTQMGSKYKKALVGKGIRESLHRWRKRGEYNLLRKSFNASLTAPSSNASLDLMEDEMDDEMDNASSSNTRVNSFRVEHTSGFCNPVSLENGIVDCIKDDRVVADF